MRNYTPPPTHPPTPRAEWAHTLIYKSERRRRGSRRRGYIICVSVRIYNGNSLNKRAKIKRLAHISDKTRFVLKLGNCKVLMAMVCACWSWTLNERFCCYGLLGNSYGSIFSAQRVNSKLHKCHSQCCLLSNKKFTQPLTLELKADFLLIKKHYVNINIFLWFCIISCYFLFIYTLASYSMYVLKQYDIL